jgi:hypothetical protein
MTRIEEVCMPRPSFALLLLLTLVLLALRCPQQPILLILVGDGSTIEACEVEVQVHAKGTADTETLAVTLNGQPLVMQEITETIFTATVPAADLLAANTVEASVDGTGGGMANTSASFTFQAAEPRLRQITDPADLITGPQASSRLGDWLLENCTARFIVQDAPQRDLTGIGQYGGNLIDAELRDHPGKDNFFEFQPMLNIETVVNADTVVPVNDGTNGSPAVLRTCGPDDPIDYINANTLVDDLLGPGSFPASANDVDMDVTACTEYKLAAGDAFVEATTTVTNHDPVDEACMYVGDYLNPSGEIEQWTSEVPGANPTGLTSGIGEMALTFNIGIFSMFGFNNAAGVDYAYIPTSFADTTPCAGSSPPGASSSFTQTGVSAILHSTSVFTTLFLAFPPIFQVPPDDGMGGNTNSFTRYFSVGDGSASNAIDLQLALTGSTSATLQGCVTAAGSPLPGARVSAGVVSGTAIEELSAHFVSGEDGCYQGQIPAPAAGTIQYGVAAAKRSHPYEGSGPTPIFHTIDVGDGDTATVDIDLPQTGRVEVTVTDEAGQPVPARVSVIGTDPSPEPTSSFSVAGQITITTATFQDATADSLPEGLVWLAYTDADGTTAFDVEPGTYDFVVSRGTEYSAHTLSSVDVDPLPAAATQIAATIAPVLDTTGFVSSDFHVHLEQSSDSQIGAAKRVRSFAGEGVDNIVTTDHDRHTDLVPTITSLGFTNFVNATIGEEITTFDYGHFNAYPLEIDPDRVSGGSTDWAGAAPIGGGFPSSIPPAYTLLPSEIFDAVFTTQRVAGGLLNTSPEIAVQVNHIDSHFSPLKIDTAAVPIRTFMSTAEKEARRFDGSTPDVDFFHPYTALEIWNGFTQGHQSEFLDDRIGIWANLLNQSIKITAIYDTDTHDFFTTRSGGARSWTPSSSDLPALVDPDEVGAAVKDGKVVGGQGIYVQTRVVARNAPGTVADFTLGGDPQITVMDGLITLEVDVQAPLWAEFDTIDIYANPTTVVTGTNGVPVLYTADPTLTLVKDTDFSVSTVQVHDPLVVPGGSRLEASLSQDFDLTVDTWLAVVVKGTDGVSQSMFPVMAANMSQGGVLALGATNALYVDVDGNGDFNGPGPLVAP